MTLFHPETGNLETRLLFDYEELWVGLVRIPPTSQFSARLRQELLDSFVKSIFRVMRSLDLSYTYDMEGGKNVGGYKVRTQLTAWLAGSTTALMLSNCYYCLCW